MSGLGMRKQALHFKMELLTARNNNANNAVGLGTESPAAIERNIRVV
jgi:hypothetical protein